MYIILNSVEKVHGFVSDVKKSRGEVDLISGRYEVDAKSLLGVFSLDLSHPVQVRIQKSDESGYLERILCRYQE